MQIRDHLSAEQVYRLGVTLGSEWQEGRSCKDLLADELDFDRQREQYHGRESAGRKPRKRVPARPRQRREK